jgi:hypothetical protein
MSVSLVKRSVMGFGVYWDENAMLGIAIEMEI